MDPPNDAAIARLEAAYRRGDHALARRLAGEIGAGHAAAARVLAATEPDRVIELSAAAISIALIGLAATYVF